MAVIYDAARVKSMTAEQLGALDAAEFASFTAAGIGQLIGPKAAVLSVPQLDQLKTVGLQHFSVAGLRALTAEQLAGVGGDGLNALLMGLSAGQAKVIMGRVAALDAADLAAIGPQHFAALEPAIFAAFTKNQVAALAAEDLDALNNNQLTAITSKGIQGITAANVVGLDGFEISALLNAPPPAAGAPAPTDAAINKAILGKVAALDVSVIDAMTPGQISSIAAKYFSFLSDKQVDALGHDALAQMTGDQLSAISEKGLRGIAAGDIASLSGDQLNFLLSGTTPKEISKNVATLSTDAMAEITLTGLDHQFMAHFSDKQVAALTEYALRDATDSQLGALSSKGLSGFSAEQLSMFDPEQFAALFDYSGPSNDVGVISKTIKSKIATLDAKDVAAVSEYSWSLIGDNTLKFLTPAQKAGLHAHDLQAMSGVQKTALGADSVISGTPGTVNDVLVASKGMDWVEGGLGTDSLKVTATNAGLKLVADARKAGTWLVQDSTTSKTIMDISLVAGLDNFVVTGRSPTADIGTTYLYKDVEKIALVGTNDAALLTLTLDYAAGTIA